MIGAPRSVADDVDKVDVAVANLLGGPGAAALRAAQRARRLGLRGAVVQHGVAVERDEPGRARRRAWAPPPPIRKPPRQNLPTANSPPAVFATTPFSVMIPAMSDPGVTSKDGFQTSMPSAATRVPETCVISDAGRSSMTMSAPFPVVGSSVRAARRRRTARRGTRRRPRGCRCRSCSRCRRCRRRGRRPRRRRRLSLWPSAPPPPSRR